ncbi:leucine-rich repeat-containing protein [Tanacetum coccineum]
MSTEYWNQWKPSQLRFLSLYFNNISGTLPELLSNRDLSSVDLSFNKFHGHIPAFPRGIRFLNLSRNKFHGGISFLCLMYEGLEFLDLSHNSLTGQLPDCLQNLTKLRVLNLGYNFLSGRLAPSLRYLDQLQMLCLYNNNFSGEFPLSLRNCTKLSFLNLGANKFIGNIPVWIGESFSGLYYLSLRSNNFIGTIPLEICKLATLQILDLSINNLHGSIPSCVNNLSTMAQKGLFVKHNVHQFSWLLNNFLVNDSYSYYDQIYDKYVDNAMIKWQGKVNEFSSNLRLVKIIDLSSNNLTGQIPNEVTNLHGLLVLDLSDNNLVGEIPRSIGQMTELLTLNLSRNLFSGKIPSSMSRMDLLNDLDVSCNNLSGRIPSGTQLQSFEPARYIGNAGLCGSPLPKKCLGDEELEEPETIGKSDGDEEGIDRWFYIGGAAGFPTGFWIICSALLLNRRGRHAFFQFHDSLKDWAYVKVGVFIAK